jgi:hypothetical protein
MKKSKIDTQQLNAEPARLLMLECTVRLASIYQPQN